MIKTPRLSPRPMIRTALAAAALLASAGLSAAASAETAEVRTGDLNLASAEGKAELTHRIDAAASRICRAEAPTGSHIRNRASERKCMQDVQRQVESRLALRGASESFGR